MDQDRLIEIATSSAFQCHKTIDYGNFENPMLRQGDRPQQCAGLMALLRNAEMPNQIMQVGERYGALDVSVLDPKGEAYASLDEAFEAHTGAPAPDNFHRRAAELAFTKP